MSGDLLIGIDAGTSVIKAVAFDPDGRIVGETSCRNIYETSPGGGVVQDMARTWTDTIGVLGELARRIDGLASRVVGLAVTGQGDGTWLVDQDGEPVDKAWLWLDARAAAHADRVARSEGMRLVYERTGTGINSCQMRAQMLWMADNAQEMLARAASAFHCKDWLYFKLTGIRATDPTEGVFTFGDFRTRDYCDDVISALGLQEWRDLLPPIVDGAKTTHGLSRSAAQATGLPEGLPVCLGYIDIACAALGAGLCDPAGSAGISIMGSTGAHLRLAENAEAVVLNSAFSGYTLALPGTSYAQLQTNMAATLNIDWLITLAQGVLEAAGVEQKREDLLVCFEALLAPSRPGKVLFHPYISDAGERGPFTDADARASLTGLSISTGWADVVRSVYEGLVLAAIDCYRAMGPLPQEIRLTGGAARSKALCSMLANGLGVPVRRSGQQEAGAAGAAMLAAIALNHFPDAATAAQAWISPLLEEAILPDPDVTEAYDLVFEGYLKTREAMKPVWAVQSMMRGHLA